MYVYEEETGCASTASVSRWSAADEREWCVCSATRLLCRCGFCSFCSVRVVLSVNWNLVILVGKRIV